MLKFNNVKIPLKATPEAYPHFVAAALHVPQTALKNVQLFKKSLDFRRREEPHYCCTFTFSLQNEKAEKQLILKNKNVALYSPKAFNWPTATVKTKKPVIIGAGPAGLFAALTLCKAGIPPLIIEQGEPVEQRAQTVAGFWQGQAVNPFSNVQFGEGGAGTFSDGKLNTGIKDPLIRTVLETFVEFGADSDILTNAKPHIGTDVLRRVVVAMRQEIERLGGRYLFSTRLTDITVCAEKLTHITLTQNGKTETLPCDCLILAVGNAARPLFFKLQERGVPLCAKAFAVGVRIEHLQQELNQTQYGQNYPPQLPPCEYKLAAHPNSRGVYTFCMCPGGLVVNAGDASNGYVTNGMSYKARNGQNANAALLVGITPEDFQNNPLGGIALQQQIEQAAYQKTGGKGLPVQTVGSFLQTGPNRPSRVTPTVLPHYVFTDFNGIFPAYVTETLQEGLKIFNQKIPGFAASDAILTAPETRSSSPVRILRNEQFESAVQGIFPCGEGAGYAGGITSSAVDGLRCALSLCK